MAIYCSPSFLFPLLRLSGRNEAVSRAAVSASAKIPAPIPLSFLSLRRRRRLALPHLKEEEEEEAARNGPCPFFHCRSPIRVRTWHEQTLPK